MATASRIISKMEIELSTKDELLPPAKLTYDGIQWNSEGRLYPRDIHFLSELLDLIRKHKEG